jgi:hypothetical protein
MRERSGMVFCGFQAIGRERDAGCLGELIEASGAELAPAIEHDGAPGPLRFTRTRRRPAKIAESARIADD